MTVQPPLHRLAFRQLARDFRAGELRLLIVAVILAVAALSAVGFFADRLNAGLGRDASQMLGGDAVISSDRALDPQFAERARALGLRTATNTTFPSMARAPDDKGGASRLVAVKAVSDGYPLRGELRIADGEGRPDVAVTRGPEPGTAWVGVGLLESLGLQVGDTLLLGDASLRITQVIVFEMDRATGISSFSPRVMLHESDLAATNLIQPASRVSYRLAVAAGDAGDESVERFVAEVRAKIREEGLRGIGVDTLESGQPQMRRTLDRAEKFLNLVALLSALLAAVAVGIASRDFADRHLDDCAMLRVLGLPQKAIASAYMIEFGVIGVCASVVGVAAGYAVHHGFVWLLSGLVQATLPAASAWPALFGLGVGLTLLVGFGLPPVLQLARVPPLRVMRRDVGALRPASMAVLGAGALGFVALLLAASADLKMGLIAVGGFAGAVLLFAGLSWLSVQLLRRAVPEARAPRWLVLATRQIAARPAFAVLQVSALSVGLLALILLVLVRTDLIDSWRAATPPDAPNRFVINVQPEQSEAFRQRLHEAGVTCYDWYPMIRGRLVAVNGRAVTPADFEDPRGRRLVNREFNLTHSATMPEHNELAGGRWTANEPNAVSVEEGLAESLGLKLGDVLRFDIAGTTAEGRITSLRKVDWGSMHANFFVMFPLAEMPDLPASYIAAFRAPDQAGFDNALSREFPNVTSIDVSGTIAQLQRVLDQVARAVEFLFGFTLAAGLVVLFAAVAATREARAREYAIMRAMGASSSLLAKVQRAELLGVGALAGFLAAGTAMVIGWALARFAFQFSWNGSPWVPLIGAAAGALLALAAGWWGLREVLRRPVVTTLRHAAV
jgi:putative ABC transport system permease protein